MTLPPFPYIVRPLTPLVAVMLAACAGISGVEPHTGRAVAHLAPTQGHETSGRILFEAVDGGVRVSGTVSGLTPGAHGFHVHEAGDCSAPDATSAGGHFNPWHRDHARATDTLRHVGDLGNLGAGDDGVAHYERVDPVISLSGPNSIIGRAVIVHAKPDNFSQPTGAAGARVACGVVAIAR